MTHTHPSHYSLQHQMVSAAPDLDKAVKELMSENMAAMVNKVLQNEPGNCVSYHHNNMSPFSSYQTASLGLPWVTISSQSHD